MWWFQPGLIAPLVILTLVPWTLASKPGWWK